jgi:Arc/MetJ-type ribon-helix-helix transcriptional regulator
MVTRSRDFMVKRYRNVSMPEELYLKLEKLVESEKAGYVSVSDAVKDSVRELLRKHGLLP